MTECPALMMHAGCLLMSIIETGALWIPPLLVNIKQMYVCLCKQQVKSLQKAPRRLSAPIKCKRKRGVNCHFQIHQTTLSVTKHTNNTEKDTKNTPWLSFGCPHKIGSVLLSTREHTYTFTQLYIHTVHTPYKLHTTDAHTQHAHTQI